MRIKNLFLISMLFVAISCSNGLHEKVIDTYPNGIPTKVEYYKWVADREVLVKHIRYYPSGEKKEEGTFENGRKNGLWTYWYQNGNKWSEGYYKNDFRDGEARVWHEGGSLNYEGFYKDGKADGEWTFYDGEGNVQKTIKYKEGRKLK